MNPDCVSLFDERPCRRLNRMCWLKTIRQTACLAFAGAFFALAAGCLVTSRSSINESGARVSQVTLDQIRPGQTTEAWVLATAGEPTSRRVVDEHTSIL